MKGFFAAIVTLSILFLILVVPFMGIMPNYSDGERTGEIYKFSKKGIFWKSWEGEMYLGGVSRDSEGGLVLDKFYFSIPVDQQLEKQEVIDKLQNCARERDVCTVVYDQWLSAPAKIGSRYVVRDVLVK